MPSNRLEDGRGHFSLLVDDRGGDGGDLLAEVAESFSRVHSSGLKSSPHQASLTPFHHSFQRKTRWVNTTFHHSPGNRKSKNHLYRMGSSNYWNDPYSTENSSALGATVTSQGIISLRLHSGIQVDTTIDKGIRVLNSQSQIIISLSPDGNSASLIHPSGLVYAYGSRVEITTTDPTTGNTKFAKMFYKGVSFTSDTSALVYLVDQAGTRTTSDTFSDLSGDFSIPVFLHNAHYGSHMVRECKKICSQTQYWITEDGTENWVVNGIRVSQTADGLVRVGRGTSKYQIRTSPTNGTATITTPSVHSTASMGIPSTSSSSSGPHLFVKRGERRLHSDGLTFIVRNAGHASGFDEFNQLKVY